MYVVTLSIWITIVTHLFCWTVSDCFPNKIERESSSDITPGEVDDLFASGGEEPPAKRLKQQDRIDLICLICEIKTVFTCLHSAGTGLLSVLTFSMAASWHHPWDPGPLSHADHLTCCHIVTPHNQLTGITQTHWFRSSATLKQKRLTIWGYVHSVCHTVDHRWNWYVSKKYRKTRLIVSSKSITYGTVLVYTTSKDHVVSKTVCCCLLAGPSRHCGRC